MARFTVTYDVVTPESAEIGETDSCGFVDTYGHHWPTDELDGSCGAPRMGLRDALRLVSPQVDSGSWFSEEDGRENYRTGASERRSLHPPRGVTGASYARLGRLLGVTPVTGFLIFLAVVLLVNIRALWGGDID